MRRLLFTLCCFGPLSGPAAGQDGVPAEPILALDAGGHTDGISGAAFTPDNKTLITSSYDKTIRTWDLTTGTAKLAFRPPIGPGVDGQISALALSPDGKLLAVGGDAAPATRPGRILLIDVAAGEIVRTLDGYRKPIRGLSFSHDGQRLISLGLNDPTPLIWNVAAGTVERPLRGHSETVRAARFSPDGSRVATGSLDETLRIWDTATGNSLETLTAHQRGVYSLAWSPDGRYLASGGGPDGTIKMWTARGQLLQTYPERGNFVFGLQFAPDSKRLLYTLGGPTNLVACYWLDFLQGSVTKAFESKFNFGSRISPDGQFIAAVNSVTPDIHVLRASDGVVVRHLNAGRSPVSGLAWLPDSLAVAIGTTKKLGTRFYDQPVERVLRLDDIGFPSAAPKPPLKVGRLREGNVELKSGLGKGDTFVVFRDGQEISRLRTRRDNDEIRSLTLLDPTRAVVGSVFGLALFDTTTGQLLRDYRGHTGMVNNVAQSPDGRYFATTSDDQTIRIWNPAKDQPLLSLFIKGDDWVAWTPGGYYACSPGGERLMGWHLNRGDDKMGVFHPAERFRAQLYRPDVIKRLLAEGSLETALAAADKALGKVTARTDVGQVLPPEVTIDAPAGPNFAAAAATVTVKASAKPVNDVPVRALRLLLDGRPFGGVGGVRGFPLANAQPVTASWDVELTPGRHTLAVLAESRVSEAQSSTVVATYRGAEEAKPGAATLHVLAVGVAKYQSYTPNLFYAADDAQALVDAFREKSAPKPFGRIDATVLTDADATRARVIKALSDLAKKTAPGDTTVVFFAGHGETDEQGLLYLIPHDADKDNLAATGLEGGQLENLLAGLKGRVILVLDACHSGAAGVAPKRGISDKLALELSRAQSGVIVMCSSLSSQLSEESNKLRRGTYTHALIEGLSGEGSRDLEDGLVYDHHLSAYVKDLVKKLTRGEQTPTVAVPGNLEPLPLAKP